MASISRTDDRKRPGRVIQFYDVDDKRRTIRLGRCGLDVAQQFKTQVEALQHVKLMNTTPAPEVSAWLAGLPDTMHKKLAAVGLVEPRVPKSLAPTLSVWLGRYVDQRTDLKPASLKRIEQTLKLLKEHFGK